MKKIALLAAAAPLMLAAPTVASAQDRGYEAGDVQLRAFVTGVLADGEITSVETDLIGLPANSDTDVSDSVVPTIAAEYFISPNISIETICCVSPHDVDGIGGLAGAELIEDAIVLPATLTAKYHFDLGGFKPYLGAGVARFFIWSEGVGADAAALGATDVDLSGEFGLALQAGIDVPINDSGLVLSVDAKRYFIDTTATFTAGNVVALQTEHQLDPWVIGAGLGLRF